MLEPVNATDTKTFAGVTSKEALNIQNNVVENCYLVYVGWDSIKDHSNYHHTKHFRDHSVILQIGHSGWREYGHIKFEGWRERSEGGVKADHASKL